MSIDTGGPAFPANVQFIQKGAEINDEGRAYFRDFMKTNGGMTLRDWFAGQALAGIVAHSPIMPEVDTEWAYKLADAMLKARSES